MKKMILAVAAMVVAGAVCRAEVNYPGRSPGSPTARVEGGIISVGNRALSVRWDARQGGPVWLSLQDEQARKPCQLRGSTFQITLSDGKNYPASAMLHSGRPVVSRLTTSTDSSRLAGRIAGWKIELPLRSADARLKVVWRAVISENANYVRLEIDLAAGEAEVGIRQIDWLDGDVPDVRLEGRVDGSVFVAGGFFFGSEDPMSTSTVTGGDHAVCRLVRNAVLKPGESLTQSFVVGVAPEGQMRRAFLCYLERERAHPYRPFLHYNSWYDIAWSPFALNEANCLDAIRTLGERFIKPHGVVLDAMVFDDGWDDPRTLWQFHGGFSRGFSPLAELAATYNSRLGVWLSPFGGYGEPRKQRLDAGRRQGYETNASGFSLAGANYYGAFRAACIRMIRDYGVNHFKFDGIASGTYANGSGADYLLDTEAMRRLMLELRKEDRDIYINLTTGSWPSPFWLRYADSVWRQGQDMGFAGKGTKQQQWLTYRDQETYRNVVGKGPLFPLNSLMTQGVAYSRHGNAGNPEFDSTGFKDDVRAFFGSGTGLQELYIQPAKLTPSDWEVLAEAARWSRANADVLVDTHWIGGDPARLEVYGYASWSSRKGIIMLRNPDDHVGAYTLDLAAAFELPRGAPGRYRAKSPWREDSARPPLTLEAGRPTTLTLRPFEILILDLLPTR